MVQNKAPGRKRKRNPYTEEELHETFEVRVRMNKRDKYQTFKLFRLITARYAPNFFSHRSVSTIDLEGVLPSVLDQFAGWLRSCYIQDQRASGDLWTGEGTLHWDRLLSFEPKLFDKDGNPLMWEDSTTDLDWMDFAIVGIDMFLFAQSYDIPRLQQDALDRLVWCFHPRQYKDCYPTNHDGLTGAIESVYEMKPSRKNSPLRELLIDGLGQVALWDDDFFLEYVPQKFLLDIARECLGVMKDPRPTYDARRTNGLVTCDYHLHENEAAKANCKVRVRM